jgi:hypothetical protein
MNPRKFLLIVISLVACALLLGTWANKSFAAIT